MQHLLVNIIKKETGYYHLTLTNIQFFNKIIQCCNHDMIEYISYINTDKQILIVNNNNDILLKLITYYRNLKVIDITLIESLQDKTILPLNILLEITSAYEEKNDTYKLLFYYPLAINNGHIESLAKLGKLHQTRNEFDLMKKYYLIGIEKENSEAMFNLATYYEKQNDTENMLKYYIMSADKKHTDAVSTLIKYYSSINDTKNMIPYLTNVEPENLNADVLLLLAEYYTGKNSTKMAQCYHHAAYKGNVDAAYKLAQHYQSDLAFSLADTYYKIAINGNHKKSLYDMIDMYLKCNMFNKENKYCVMVAENGYEPAMIALADIYYKDDIHKTLSQINDMLKYYLQLCSKRNFTRFKNLCDIYIQTAKYKELMELYAKYPDEFSKNDVITILIKYLESSTNISEEIVHIIGKLNLENVKNVPIYLRLLNKTLGKQMDLLEMHFKYAPNTEGYNKAKADFIGLLNDGKNLLLKTQ